MSDLGKTAPKRGGRVRLELTGRSAQCVRYALTMVDSEVRVEAVVEVALADGKVSGVPETGPSWLRSLATSLLRTMYRQRESAGWPRRVTRWRAAKDPTGAGT